MHKTEKSAMPRRGMDEWRTSTRHLEDHDDPPRSPAEDRGILEELLQGVDTSQGIVQLVYVKDSEKVAISLTNIQAFINLQLALQLAIDLVLNLALADSASGTRVRNQLIESATNLQSTLITVVVDNSYNVTVSETGVDLAANIQLLFQVLLALVARLEVA